MPELQWPLILNNLVQLGIAYVLTLPVAFDRSESSRAAASREVGKWSDGRYY